MQQKIWQLKKVSYALDTKAGDSLTLLMLTHYSLSSLCLGKWQKNIQHSEFNSDAVCNPSKEKKKKKT